MFKAPGLAPTPISMLVCEPIGLPPMSSPWLRLLTMLVKPMESTSNTALASGYVPMRGGSPVMQIRFRTPVVCAPNNSD